MVVFPLGISRASLTACSPESAAAAMGSLPVAERREGRVRWVLVKAGRIPAHGRVGVSRV